MIKLDLRKWVVRKSEYNLVSYKNGHYLGYVMFPRIKFHPLIYPIFNYFSCFSGRGHLACVTFAGGRGYPRRKHLFSDEYRDIGDEIKVRSYYNKNLHQSNRLDDALTLPTGENAK